MERLFYFTGYRLIVFHWKGQRLDGVVSFEPILKDLSRFKDYLHKSVNIPTKLLVDVIEEDFRVENVPHVGVKDRKAVIDRLLDRYYRSSKEYCYDEVIGRKKDGRKDDEVLIGAMTNPALIQPWMSIIDECDVSLSGIWSSPLVSAELLVKLNANKGVTLLVSQAVKSNVRQTLFRDGKLLSSRQSVINQEISDAGKIAEHIAGEVERTLIFLRNQDMLSADEPINVHIIGSEQQLKALSRAFANDDRQTVHSHSIKKIASKLKIENVDEEFSDGIFAWLCLHQKIQLSHYGERKLFNRYYSLLASKALFAASVLILVLGFLLTEANISSALGDKEAIDIVKTEEHEYKEIYSAKFKAFEKVFKNAEVMNSAVELANNIKRNSQTSPLGFMLRLSQIFSQKTMSEIHIDGIKWWPVNTDKNNKIINAKKGINKINFTATTPVFHQALIDGRINVAENNYRESINQIDMITDALMSDPAIENVEVISMPVDLRSDSKFSAQSGLESSNSKEQDLSGKFTLKLTMRNKDNG